MVRGPKKHLKRLNAPSHWMLDKLGGIFVSHLRQCVLAYIDGCWCISQRNPFYVYLQLARPWQCWQANSLLPYLGYCSLAQTFNLP